MDSTTGTLTKLILRVEEDRGAFLRLYPVVFEDVPLD